MPLTILACTNQLLARVTTNKYVHTPQGVFELKYFFTTGIKTSNGDVSSSSVKDKIKNIIAAESADNPISDQQIVDMLKAESIEIARRTVAKYERLYIFRLHLGVRSHFQCFLTRSPSRPLCRSRCRCLRPCRLLCHSRKRRRLRQRLRQGQNDSKGNGESAGE